MLNKVLVVDDSQLIHQMYRLVFGRYRCRLEVAMNGQQALDLLSTQDDIDLVLLDINMPVMNGVQFLERCSLDGLTDKAPIVVVSTEGKEEDTLKALKLGARGYLTKPFTASQLHEIVQKLVTDDRAATSGSLS
jgi:two-component system, chemotaxis family, chemotaxis protein CheY